MITAMVLAASTLATPAPIPDVPDEHQEAVYGAMVRLSLANICERTSEDFRDASDAEALLERALIEAGHPNPAGFSANAAERVSAATPEDARLGRAVCTSLSQTIAEAMAD